MPLVSEYIIVGAAMFAMGMVGFLARRNLIVMFLSTEVMFQGVVITAVASPGSTTTSRDRRTHCCFW